MRLALFLLVWALTSSVYASECNEIHPTDSTAEITELQGLEGCTMRASIYLYALSSDYSKEVYKNYYNCKGRDVKVIVERSRTSEVTKYLVSEAEVKMPLDLEIMSFNKSTTSLEKFITNIEMNNNVKCSEQTSLFSSQLKRNFLCGQTKLKVLVKPYITCIDSWKSL